MDHTVGWRLDAWAIWTSSGVAAWETPVDAILSGFENGLTFPEPTFPVLPEDWRDRIGEVGGMVATFHKNNPGRLTQFPDDPARQSGPWASPRTWEYAVCCKAASRHAMDVALGSSIGTFTKAMPKNAKMSAYFVQELAPKVMQVLVQK